MTSRGDSMSAAIYKPRIFRKANQEYSRMSNDLNHRRTNEEHRGEPSDPTIETHLASSLLESLGENRRQEAPETEEDIPRAARALVEDAVRQRATDLHLDPEARGLRVRMRIDGAVRDAALLVHRQGRRLINQLKGLAGIDPVAQFSADEARFAVPRERGNINLRLSSVPCLDGQKMTVRVLDPRQVVYGIHELGLSDADLNRVRHWFASLGGMFVVAGPVGSGKTTTLYSLLHELRVEACSACTLEDPVEYSIDGINQVQIDEEHGLTFSEGVRALARHDPDVILVGELRDAATARAAYGAAALGRTILTTMHARDAAGAVTGLRYFGLNDRDIATTLAVVVAQRLVRKLCPHCRRRAAPTEEQTRWFELIGVPLPEACWEPDGCERCGGSGYYGQTGVFEVWRLEDEDYHMLLGGATERDIRDSLVPREHKHFLSDAIEKAKAGVTSPTEVQRLHLAGPAFMPGAASLRASAPKKQTAC